jgi:hypothetical protein
MVYARIKTKFVLSNQPMLPFLTSPADDILVTRRVIDWLRNGVLTGQ